MNDFDADGFPESDWEERGGLVWNEFDWERYLREQDEAIHRYLGFYEAFRGRPDRIDLVAEQMGWEPTEKADEADGAEQSDADAAGFPGEAEVYTLHKNPVFVATKAISLSVRRPWEILASQPGKISPSVAIPFLVCLHRSEDNAVQAIHALDCGDYAMAVSLLKRALGALNEVLAFLDADPTDRHSIVQSFRDEAVPRLFDLREVWLRVIAECRRELDRPVDDENPS